MTVFSSVGFPNLLCMNVLPYGVEHEESHKNREKQSTLSSMNAKFIDDKSRIAVELSVGETVKKKFRTKGTKMIRNYIVV